MRNKFNALLMVVALTLSIAAPVVSNASSNHAAEQVIISNIIIPW
ncbi:MULTISPECIES: hypothetical protein [unclassified Paenibacillus]|nr:MULTISPECIES: hypothetical protein [unclassified Paenibacillus]MDK8181061.1 hypothetical protein [Paenibacillus sp. UMB4589-SE434]